MAPSDARTRIPPRTMILAAFLGLFIAFVGAQGVAWLVLMALASARGGHLPRDPAAFARLLVSLPVIATSLIVTAVGFVGAAVLAARASRVDVRDALGLERPDPRIVFAASIGIVGLGPTSDMLVRAFLAAFPTWTIGNLELLIEVTRRHSLLATFPLVVLVAAFGEELFFRGLVQRSIANVRVAIPVSAIAFAIIHFDPPHVLGVVPLGFYLAWMAHRGASTWVSFGAHAVNNAFALASVRLADPSNPIDDAPTPPWVVALGLVVAFVAVAYVAQTTRRRDESAPEGSSNEPTSATSE